MITIRVCAKTSNGEYRQVTVNDAVGSAVCNCGGFDGAICSHIDAVLVAEEDAMVHDDDLEFVTRARDAVRGRIIIPEAWRATWRRNLR